MAARGNWTLAGLFAGAVVGLGLLVVGLGIMFGLFGAELRPLPFVAGSLVVLLATVAFFHARTRAPQS